MNWPGVSIVRQQDAIDPNLELVRREYLHLFDAVEEEPFKKH